MSNAKIPDCRECPVRHRSIMKDLEEGLLEQIGTAKHCDIYRKGDVIFREGNRPQGLYAIYSGKVKVYKTNERGKDQILRLTKAGDALGYRALISGEHYMASAEALEDSRICFIPKSTFDTLLQTSDKLFARIIKVLAEDLKVAESQIAAMATKTVRERTAEALVIIHNYYGVNADGSLSVAMSREDLASMVGTATESLIRMLSEFKSEGLIDLKDKKIIIKDLKKIEKAANIFD